MLPLFIIYILGCFGRKDVEIKHFSRGIFVWGNYMALELSNKAWIINLKMDITSRCLSRCWSHAISVLGKVTRRAKVKNRILGYSIIKQAASTNYNGTVRSMFFSFKWKGKGLRREGLRESDATMKSRKFFFFKEYCFSNAFQYVEKN